LRKVNQPQLITIVVCAIVGTASLTVIMFGDQTQPGGRTIGLAGMVAVATSIVVLVCLALGAKVDKLIGIMRQMATVQGRQITAQRADLMPPHTPDQTGPHHVSRYN
jgi:hypothetical protein